MKTENPTGVHFERPLSITYSTMVTLEMEIEKSDPLCNVTGIKSLFSLEPPTTWQFPRFSQRGAKFWRQQTGTVGGCYLSHFPQHLPAPFGSFLLHIHSNYTPAPGLCTCFLSSAWSAFSFRWPRGWLVPSLLSSLYSEVTFVESPLLATLCNI